MFNESREALGFPVMHYPNSTFYPLLQMRIGRDLMEEKLIWITTVGLEGKNLIVNEGGITELVIQSVFRANTASSG